MADRDFVVKNGLVVNTNLIVANTSTNRIGILTTTPDAPLTVVGAANVQGNAVITGTANITGNSTITGNANVGGNAYFLTNINVNANVQLSNTQLLIGNTTVNTTVNSTAINIGNTSVYTITNSTAFSGTANNSLYLGGVIASAYINSTGNYTISGLHTYANSIVIGAAYGISANATYGGPNQLLTSNGTSVFWSDPPASANSSGGTGAIQYYNGATLGACSAITFSAAANSFTVGNSTVNAVVNSTSIVVGNSTVNGTITSNSTTSYYTGTANNSLYLGGVISTSYINATGAYTISGVHTHSAATNLNGSVSIANSITANSSVGNPGFVLTSSGASGANVYWAAAVNTANQYTFTNAISITSTGSLTLNGAVFITNSVTANAQIGSAGQILTSGGTSANVYWSNPTSANSSGGTGAIQYYNGTTFGSASGLSFSAATNTINVSNTVSVNGYLNVGNTTIFANITSNSTATYFTGISYTANNALSLGGTLASGYQTTAGLSANVATLTADNANKLGTIAAANYLTNTAAATISGVHTHSAAVVLNGAVTIANSITANSSVGTGGNVLASGGAGANVYWTAAVTSVTGTSPVVSSGGATPAISMAAATTSVPGYLTAADWTTFNNKAPINSPTFTGTPTVPGYLTTATAGTTYAPLASPTFTGTVTIPAGASISGFAPLASPTFTGTPTVPGYLTTATASSTYAPIASPTFTGTVTTANTKFNSTYYANAISSASSINCSLGNYFYVTVTGSATFTFSNPPASGNVYSMAIKISSGGSTPTLTWPASAKWPSATAPTPSSNTDIWVFLTDDGGTIWRGVLAMKDSR